MIAVQCETLYNQELFWGDFSDCLFLNFKSQIKRLFDHVFLNLPITINYKFGNNVS